MRAQRRVKLAAFDRQLRKFRYKEALDSALDPGQPETVASVLQELAARAGLNAALGAALNVQLLEHQLIYYVYVLPKIKR